MKTLEIYERENIVGQIQKKSPAFVARLEGLIDHPFVGEAKALGLIGGIELVADKNTRRAFDPKKGVAAKCVSFAQNEGLIVRPLGGDRIAFCPPLVISEAEIHEMFDRFERGLKRMADWITAEGLAQA